MDIENAKIGSAIVGIEAKDRNILSVLHSREVFIDLQNFQVLGYSWLP
jgi:hypothetical protein